MIHVLYEDNHLLVVNKPVGIATMGSESGPTLHTLVSTYLKKKYNKPGNVYVGIVSRLDTVTSGVLVLAKTSKAAARLSKQFREATTHKVYWGVVHGQVPEASIEMVDWVWKDERSRRMRCASHEVSGSQQACLRMQRLAQYCDRALVQVELLTGRKHQIRVQLSAAGNPIWGDQKYDASSKFGTGIALHAHTLQVNHPTLSKRMRFSAPPPEKWKQLGVHPDLGS